MPKKKKAHLVENEEEQRELEREADAILGGAEEEIAASEEEIAAANETLEPVSQGKPKQIGIFPTEERKADLKLEIGQTYKVSLVKVKKAKTHVKFFKISADFCAALEDSDDIDVFIKILESTLSQTADYTALLRGMIRDLSKVKMQSEELGYLESGGTIEEWRGLVDEKDADDIEVEEAEIEVSEEEIIEEEIVHTGEVEQAGESEEG
jgi:hypothetical protein